MPVEQNINLKERSGGGLKENKTLSHHIFILAKFFHENPNNF